MDAQSLAQKEKVISVRPVQGMWTFDPAQHVPDGASPDMYNFHVYSGVLRKRPGFRKYGNVQPGSPITGVSSVQDNNGQTYLFATTATNLWWYNPATDIWEVMSGPELTGTNDDLFSFEVSENCLVFCQGIDNIMCLPLGTTTYAILSPEALPAKYLCRWNGRLYAGHTLESTLRLPYRLRWPVFNDHTNWTGLGSGFVDLTDEPTSIRQLRKLLSTMVIYNEKSVYSMTATGLATPPHQIDLVVKNLGLYSPFSVWEYNIQHFLLATDNGHIFNGMHLVPMFTPIRDTMYNELNPTSQFTNFGIVLYESQEYVCFVSVDEFSVPNKAWAFNFTRGIVYPWTFVKGHKCACMHKLDSQSPMIQDLIGTIAEQTYPIMSSFLLETYPAMMTGHENGTIYRWGLAFPNDDGAPISSRWCSRDFTARDIDPILDNRMVTLRGVGVKYLDQGTPFTLDFYYSTNYGSAWQGPYTMVLGGQAAWTIDDAFLSQQITGKRVRFKFEHTSDTERPVIIELSPVLESRGQMIQ
jgi:hypothetical protein